MQAETVAATADASVTVVPIAPTVYGKVKGEPFTCLPHDLYIPPDALEVLLEAFEGPLDLLLYLINKNDVDILDIPVAEITAQYMAYVDLMKQVRLELAADYLVMAAMLAEIKSRWLLPPSENSDEAADESDPRAELVRRLQQYERFKQAAEALDQQTRLERDVYVAAARFDGERSVAPPPTIPLPTLLQAMQAVMARSNLLSSHRVTRESLSVRERMVSIVQVLSTEQFTVFSRLFKPEEGRMGVVVTFIAVLELLKGALIECTQQSPFAPIYLRAADRSDTV